MHQITIRLNDRGLEELEKIKKAMGFKKNAPAIENCLLSWRSACDTVDWQLRKIAELEQEKKELQAIIAYLEAKGEKP